MKTGFEQWAEKVASTAASETSSLNAYEETESRPSLLNRITMRAAVFVQVLVIVAAFGVGITRAACFPFSSQGEQVTTNRDPVAMVLAASETCPANVFEFRARILKAGGRIETAMVNNQGFHNPNVGNFSLFEMVSGQMDDPVGVTVAAGDFFFGHFTAAQGGALIANQAPRGLMIELIAFDPSREAFNFYELIGDGARSRWFYRGDSLDVIQDIEFLHHQKDPAKPQFGERLRCSGCHMGGGPILKELAAPHNDWFTTTRPLPFGQLTPNATLNKILAGSVDASRLAEAVTAGINKLYGSSKFRDFWSKRSAKEQLRCLFCPVELNLESDTEPFDEDNTVITIPSGFLVDPRLAQATISVPREHYRAALQKVSSRFPRTSRTDADHTWLAPVKAAADILAIDMLFEQKVIDAEFVADVLAVDLTNPAFSKQRCGLLQSLPDTLGADWQKTFIGSLRTRTDPAAKELLTNLTESERTAEFHRTKAAAFLKNCQSKFQTPNEVLNMVRVLGQTRAAVFENEISMNPLGQILEPGERPGEVTDNGFKLVFPAIPGIRPFQARPELRVTETCDVVEVP